MGNVKIYLSIWLVPPMSLDIGECEVAYDAPAEVLAVAAVFRSAQRVSIDPKRLSELFRIYNRTQCRFLDYNTSLRAQSVEPGDHIVVSIMQNETELNRHFAPRKPSAFDRAVEDILRGR